MTVRRSLMLMRNSSGDVGRNGNPENIPFGARGACAVRPLLGGYLSPCPTTSRPASVEMTSTMVRVCSLLTRVATHDDSA